MERSNNCALKSGPAANILRIYLREVGRHRLLSRWEEIKLIKEFQKNGNEDAKELLVTSNLRLVVKIALNLQGYWTQNFMDLIQEGNIGLMRAVQKFDPNRGYKFSYYAVFWIKAYIIRFIMDNWSLVKIGTTQAQRKLFFNLRKEKERLETRGIDVSTKLLSEHLDVKESEVAEMDQRLQSGGEISLDNPLKDGSEDTHGSFLVFDGLPVDEIVADAEIQVIIHNRLMQFRSRLKGRELGIFDGRLIAEDPMTLKELGDQFGISRERIRQIEKRVKGKLKGFIEKEGFRRYLSL